MDKDLYFSMDFLKKKIREKMNPDDLRNINYEPYRVTVHDWIHNIQVRMDRFKEVFYEELHQANRLKISTWCQKALLKLYSICGFTPPKYIHHGGENENQVLTKKQEMWYQTLDEYDGDIEMQGIIDPEVSDGEGSVEGGGEGSGGEGDEDQGETDEEAWHRLCRTVKIVTAARNKNIVCYMHKNTGARSKGVPILMVQKLHELIWLKDGRNFINKVVLRNPGDPIIG
jgi:hypothetical protein